MTAIESAFVDQRTFDPAVLTPARLVDIEPAITFIATVGTHAAVAPTALAAAHAVDYFGTVTTYAVGAVSASGNTFGVVVDKGVYGSVTFYRNGVTEDW